MLGVSCSSRTCVFALSLTLLLVACQSGVDAGDETTVPTSAPSPSTSTLPPPTTTTEPAPTSTGEPTTTRPEASERQFGFAEPFSVTIPTAWTRFEESTQQLLYIEAGINVIVFAVSDRETVDEWREFLTGNEGLIVSEPTPADIGGAPGFTTDVRLSSEATDAGCLGQGRCVPVLSGSRGWVIAEGLPNRVWVVDVAGRPIFIAAEASESSFEAFATSVEQALDTLTWGSET
jgi:hypothetical protein